MQMGPNIVCDLWADQVQETKIALPKNPTSVNTTAKIPMLVSKTILLHLKCR